MRLSMRLTGLIEALPEFWTMTSKQTLLAHIGCVKHFACTAERYCQVPFEKFALHNLHLRARGWKEGACATPCMA